MTSEEAIERLKKCHTGDTEADHCNDDDVLRDFLNALGYRDVVTAYDKVSKWFA